MKTKCINNKQLKIKKHDLRHIKFKGLYYSGVSITDTDRNTLLTSIYAKALDYYGSGVALNRFVRTGVGTAPILDPTPGTTSYLIVNYTGYYLIEG